MASLPCWICGDPADSGEHIVKRSDLKSLVGTPSQSDPIYLHTANRRNRRIGSLDADALKSPARICQRCNNARTQPHDHAWQTLSEWFRSRHPAVRPGERVRCNSVFLYDTARSMRHVHLYLLKLFGLKIVEAGISIDIQPFAHAILHDGAHPNVYVAFGPRPADDPDPAFAGGSDVQFADLNGRTAFAAWIHHVGNLWVQVMYADPSERRQGLVGAWHPRFGHRRLEMRRF